MSKNSVTSERFGLSRRTFIAGAGFTAAAMASFALAGEGLAEAPAAGGTRTVVDLAGREVEIPENVTKIAALTGPVYETIIMLGGEGQVAITGNGGAKKGWATIACPEYAEIPVTESAVSPNIEELMSLGVEVALFWDSYPEVTQAMEEAGIKVVFTQLNDDGIDTPEQFLELKKREIRLVADVLGGDCVAKAEKWCEFVDATVAKITEKTGALTEDEIPSVYYVRGPEATKIHGGESYTYYLVTMAGGDLVSKNDHELLYDTTVEQAMEWNPEYIFMGRVDNVELITEDPAWAPIQAVVDGNVYVNLKCIGPTDYSTDCFLLMEQVATILHPDLFEDIDMVEEVKYYFAEFYDTEITDEQAELVLVSKGPEA